MFIEKIRKEVLLKPLQAIIGIVERKQSLPILANVLIERTGQTLKFIATDLEIQIEAQCSDPTQNNNAVQITVAAKKLQDILRVIPEESNISLDIQDGSIQIKGNKSRFSLQTLPAQDFPKIAEQQDQTGTLEIGQSQLKKLFSMVHYAMAQQDIRYYLNGVLLVINGNTLKMIATDGHRLAYATTTLDKEYAKNEIILPRKTVSEFIKLLADTEEKVTLAIWSNQIKASFSNIVITSKIIDGKFPD